MKSFRVIIAAMLLGLNACGYTWQGTGNPWRDKGVTTVYIRTLTNNTVHSGVEVPFTSALVREFARAGRFRLVADEKAADGIISGSIGSADSKMSTQSTVGQLTSDPPEDIKDMIVASEYIAEAGITIQLIRARDKKVLWAQSFAHSKIYPANNRLGNAGTTSALINMSQEQLALGDIASFLARDVHDAMFEAF